jgi:hypothetical protein
MSGFEGERQPVGEDVTRSADNGKGKGVNGPFLAQVLLMILMFLAGSVVGPFFDSIRTEERLKGLKESVVRLEREADKGPRYTANEAHQYQESHSKVHTELLRTMIRVEERVKIIDSRLERER